MTCLVESLAGCEGVLLVAFRLVLDLLLCFGFY